MPINESYVGHTDLLETVLLDNPKKGIQYRLTISEFRDVTYIGIREWYEGFEGDYLPSKNGVTLPYTLHTTSRLYTALKDILSDAEVLDAVIQEAQSDGNSGTDEDME